MRALAAAAAALLLAAGPAAAQQMYVCQTPQFWCSFQHHQSGVPDGTQCYCNSWQGPVGGYSIDPNRGGGRTTGGKPTAGGPETRIPDTRIPDRRTPPPVATGGGGDSDDCFRGLGNCEGHYR